MTQEEVNKANREMLRIMCEADKAFNLAVETAREARAEAYIRARKIYDDAGQKQLLEQKSGKS